MGTKGTDNRVIVLGEIQTFDDPIVDETKAVMRNKMILGITSDTHGNLPEIELLEGIDILVHCGDIGPDYDVNNWLTHKFSPWLQKLNDLGIDFIGVYGNHDFPSKWNMEFPTIKYWHSAEIATKAGWLSAYSPKFYDWAWMKTEKELREMYNKIPKDVEILVSHTPPFGIGDFMARGEHVGSQALREWLDENPQCKYVLCGHIHEGWGRYPRENGQLIINAAYCDEYYTPMQRIQRLTL